MAGGTLSVELNPTQPLDEAALSIMSDRDHLTIALKRSQSASPLPSCRRHHIPALINPPWTSAAVAEPGS